MPLSEAISNYLLRLGYTSAQAGAIFIQLLTRGKVRVDFREHYERLELVDLGDKLPMVQAMSVFGDYVAELSRGQPKNLDGGDTQRIIIQSPKNPSSDGR